MVRRVEQIDWPKSGAMVQVLLGQPGRAQNQIDRTLIVGLEAPTGELMIIRPETQSTRAWVDGRCERQGV